jgi:N-glycosylase/DNA lyase
VPSTGALGEPCLKIEGIAPFDTDKIFDCGQCFRFDPVAASSHEIEFGGVINGHYLTVGQDEPHSIVLHNATEADLDGLLRFFALDVDYAAIDRRIKAAVPSAIMHSAVEFGQGIRILRQDGFEALCSFILSQNNNIPRIKGLIESLCRAYGEPFTDAYGTHYAFPTPEALAAVSEADLRALRVGFRAPYLADAAKRWVSGEIDTCVLANGTYGEAEAMLTRIRGVGPKVAACVLLFGFGRTDAFPIDVWIKKVLATHFGGTFPVDALGDAAGIAQQYLFYLGRYSDLFK